MRGIVVALCLAALAACGTLPEQACATDAEPAAHDLLYFGAQTPDGGVDDADWAGFLAETVTPRFPDGLTAWTASGQWRSASGEIVRESTYVLSLVHPADANSDAALRDIVATYKARFAQEAVLRVRSPACMSLR